MNANELADAMDTHGFRYHHVRKAVIMLRQQQAEIEALNHRIERMIENQSHHEGIAHAGGFEAGYQAAKAKTLTDDEIAQAWAETKGDILHRLMPFAKAILRKAQENDTRN